MQALQIVRGGREPGAARARHAAGARGPRARDVLAPHAAACCTTATLFLRDARASTAVSRRPPDAASSRRTPTSARWSAKRSDSPSRRVRGRAHRGIASRSRAVRRGVRRARRGRIAQGRDAIATPRCGTIRSRRPTTLAALAAPASTIRAALVAALARMRARRRATRSCPRCRASASTRSCRALLAVAARASRSPARRRQLCSSACSALLEAVSRRSAYLALLIEHPPLLPRLAQLMGASAWAADYLTRHPLLLDELLDARVLLAEPDWQRMARRARAPARAHTPTTPSAAMDALRHFQHAQTFRLLAQDLAGQLTRRAAGRSSVRARRHDPRRDARLLLAQLQGADRAAAALRDHRLRQARRQGARLRVRPRPRVPVRRRCRRTPTPTRRPSATRGSRSGSTRGSPARRPPGALYETDLRLRPDGAAGLLVSSIARFRPLPARAGVDVGAPGADARALRRRRRASRRGVRARARSRSCACRAIRRGSPPTSSPCARGWHAGHPNRTRAVRPQARPGRHGRHRVHRAVSRARMRTRTPS